METQEVLDKLTPIFHKVFNDEDLNVDMELTSADIDEWSSLSQAILLTEIETAYGIKFKLREVAKMDNVRAIVALIQEKLC